MTELRRPVGAGEQRRCPVCKSGVATLTRRGPDPVLGDAYERQRFSCPDCGHEFHHTVNKAAAMAGPTQSRA